MEQQLVVRPIGNLIEPGRAIVEEQQGKTEGEQEYALKDFEKRDQLEITNATMLF
jgi:hypothetical protein